MGKGIQKQYYPIIDLVRFSAAMSVMLFHLTFAVWAVPESSRAGILPPSILFPEFAQFTWWGWVGVQVFFVISGAVIANSACGNDASGFIKSRVMRLYPAVWVCSAITAVILIYWGMYPVSEFLNRYIRSITLFPVSPWIDGVYWTLAVEIVFYASIAVLLTLNAFGKVEVLAAVLATITAVSQVAIYFDIGRELPKQIMRLGMLDYGSFFALGIAIWSFAVLGKTRIRLLLVLYSCAACVLQIFNYTFSVQETVISRSPSLHWQPPLIVWSVAVLTIAVGYALPYRYGGRALRAIRTLGLMTYPLYLLHYTCGVFVMSEASKLGLDRFTSLVAAAICAVFLSWSVARFLEPCVYSVVSHPVSCVIEWFGKRIEMSINGFRRVR